MVYKGVKLGGAKLYEKEVCNLQPTLLLLFCSSLAAGVDRGIIRREFERLPHKESSQNYQLNKAYQQNFTFHLQFFILSAEFREFIEPAADFLGR